MKGSYNSGAGEPLVERREKMKAVFLVVLVICLFPMGAVADGFVPLPHPGAPGYEGEVLDSYGQVVREDCDITPLGGYTESGEVEMWYLWHQPKVSLVTFEDRIHMQVWYGRCLREIALGYQDPGLSYSLYSDAWGEHLAEPWSFAVLGENHSDATSIVLRVCTIVTESGSMYVVKGIDPTYYAHGNKGVNFVLFVDYYTVEDGAPACDPYGL